MLEWVPSDVHSSSVHPRSGWVCFFIRFGEMLSNGCCEVNGCRQNEKHITPVHQLTSGEDNIWNKSSIKKYESIIHNNSSSSEKVFWSESGEKSAAFTRQNSSKQIHDWIMMRDESRCTFSLEEELLWIIDSYFLMDLFQLLSSPDDNCWTVDYCDVFISLSFWRHPFTAEHPLLRHVYKPDEETNSFRMIWGHCCFKAWDVYEVKSEQCCVMLRCG